VYRRIHGQYDGFVTPRGYLQIKHLYRRFEDVRISAVYSSDLFRTRETARAVSEAHGLNVNLCPALREISFSAWEDMTWGDALFKYPAEYSVWEKTPHEFKLSGGESYGDIYARSKAELDRISKLHPNESVAVVSHGTVIRALICMLTRYDMSRVTEVPWCDNTAVAKLCVDSDLNYTVDFFNDNSHLKELSTLGRQRWWKDDYDPIKCNLRFVPAVFPEDMDKADDYYRDSWSSLFGSESYDSKYTRSRLKRVLNAHPEAVMFARQGGGEDVGIIVLDTNTHLLPRAGHIMLLYLKGEFRGMEMGAQLLGHAVSIYRGMGMHWVTVRVASCNDRARKFYDKYGFEQFGAEQTDNGIQLLLRKSINGTPANIDWK